MCVCVFVCVCMCVCLCVCVRGEIGASISSLANWVHIKIVWWPKVGMHVAHIYHMRDTFNAGYILCVDEMISIWYSLDQQGSDVYVFQDNRKCINWS